CAAGGRMTVSGYERGLLLQTHGLVESFKPDIWQEQLGLFRQSSRLQLRLIRSPVVECHQ
ncbi:hypothetical protein MNBD_GAMMA24-688, partial [hydrothermal vent metagenome]